MASETGAGVPVHGSRSAYASGCRCADCKNAARQYNAERRAKRASDPDHVIEHGTSNAYYNDACRCADCKNAARQYNAERRAKRASDPNYVIEHGTTSAYYNDACRCADCKNAASHYNAEQRAKRANDPKRVVQHGTTNGYVNDGCRCTECRTAMRDYQLQTKYGVSLEDYEAMLARQNGACGACGGEATRRGFHVDHDHKSGRVRGLLCHNCNVALGHLKDDPERIRGLLSYILHSSDSFAHRSA